MSAKITAIGLLVRTLVLTNNQFDRCCSSGHNIISHWLCTDDPAQKRILANDRSRQPPKIFDSCSRSEIYLWSPSKILRRSPSRRNL